MKKLLLIILALGIFSCSKKNIFEEIQTDMKNIVTEASKIEETIKTSKEEVPEISTDKIKELNEKFKKKYQTIEIKTNSNYQEACKIGISKFNEQVDAFLDIYAKRVKINNENNTISKKMNLSFAQKGLSENIKGMQIFVQFCEIAKNENK
jgi:lipoprotein